MFPSQTLLVAYVNVGVIESYLLLPQAMSFAVNQGGGFVFHGWGNSINLCQWLKDAKNQSAQCGKLAMGGFLDFLFLLLFLWLGFDSSFGKGFEPLSKTYCDHHKHRLIPVKFTNSHHHLQIKTPIPKLPKFT